MASGIREGDGVMEKGKGRIRITITTKENDFAECTIERLDERIELEPVDMVRARRAMKNGYSEFKRQRTKAIKQETKETEAGNEQEETTEFESVLASDSVVDVENGDTTEGSTEVLEPAVAVIEKGGDDGYDE